MLLHQFVNIVNTPALPVHCPRVYLLELLIKSGQGQKQQSTHLHVHHHHQLKFFSKDTIVDILFIFTISI